MGAEGEEGLDLSQEARVLVTRAHPATAMSHHFVEGRGGYVYALEGGATLGDAEELPLEFQPVGVWAGPG